jgi:hypothetical protein
MGLAASAHSGSNNLLKTCNWHRGRESCLADAAASFPCLMERAATASERSYLLYYSPSDTVRDGRFRKIEVRVKNRDHRVSFMAGYFAN